MPHVNRQFCFLEQETSARSLELVTIVTLSGDVTVNWIDATDANNDSAIRFHLRDIEGATISDAFDSKCVGEV